MPLYDASTRDFTPAALVALKEVFSRFDHDLDGLLNRCGAVRVDGVDPPPPPPSLSLPRLPLPLSPRGSL